MQSTGQTSTQALSLTSMHGSTITYVMVISPSSAPPLSSGVDDSVPRVCEPTASKLAQGRGLQVRQAGHQARRPSNGRFGGHGRDETARPSLARLTKAGRDQSDGELDISPPHATTWLRKTSKRA